MTIDAAALSRRLGDPFDDDLSDHDNGLHGDCDHAYTPVWCRLPADIKAHGCGDFVLCTKCDDEASDWDDDEVGIDDVPFCSAERADEISAALAALWTVTK